MEDEVDRVLLKSAILKLTDREKHIMELRFGFKTGVEKTQKEVADMLRNITKLHIKTWEKDNEQNEKRHNEQDTDNFIIFKHTETVSKNSPIWLLNLIKQNRTAIFTCKIPKNKKTTWQVNINIIY